MLANLHAIDRSGFIGCIIVNLLGFPLQFGDIVFVRSDIACCCEGFDLCINLIINLSLGIEMGQRLIYTVFGIYLNGARRSRRIHLHGLFRTRYAQSSAKERQRKERGESRTAHGLPARTLRMRLRDFRRYHIAILCLGPDDFVDAVHNDFPLCEKQ